jgi:hypothetical protein
MAIVITISVATALILLGQAVHVLTRGQTQIFFLHNKRLQGKTTLRMPMKIAGALMYGIPGCAVLLILTVAIVKNGPSFVLARIAADIGNLIGGVILFAAGLLALFRPDVVLGWAAAAHPDVAVKLDTQFGGVLTRVLGTLLLGFGLLILAFIKP